MWPARAAATEGKKNNLSADATSWFNVYRARDEFVIMRARYKQLLCDHPIYTFLYIVFMCNICCKINRPKIICCVMNMIYVLFLYIVQHKIWYYIASDTLVVNNRVGEGDSSRFLYKCTAHVCDFSTTTTTTHIRRTKEWLFAFTASL